MNWLIKISQADEEYNEDGVVDSGESNSEDLFSGNCGMYAIALGKRAMEAGHQVGMLVCANVIGSDDLIYGDPTVYHIAVEIDGVLYDGRGKTTLQEVGEFAADTYGDYQPECGKYDLDDTFIMFARTQTDWSTYWETYYSKISLEDLI